MPACRCRRDLVSKEGDSTEVSRLFYDKQLIVAVAGQVVDGGSSCKRRWKSMGGRSGCPTDASGLALGDASCML